MGCKAGEPPRRPKNFFLEQQKCLQRPKLKLDHLSEIGGKAVWMVGKSPGIFFHQPR